MIRFVVRKGVLGADDCRGNFRWEDRTQVFTAPEIAQINYALSLVTAAENVIPPLPYEIETQDGTVFPVDIYVQRGNRSPLLRLRFRSKVGAPVTFDSRPHMRSRYALNDVLYLQKVAPNRLKIIGCQPALSAQPGFADRTQTMLPL